MQFHWKAKYGYFACIRFVVCYLLIKHNKNQVKNYSLPLVLLHWYQEMELRLHIFTKGHKMTTSHSICTTYTNLHVNFRAVEKLFSKAACVAQL